MTRPERALLTVHGEGEAEIAGMAFLVGDSLALTCAHVVNMALRTARSADVTGATVRVRPAFQASGRSSDSDSDSMATDAVVERWSARSGPRRADDDIAVLRLDRPVVGTEPVPLGTSADLVGRPVRAFGIPEKYPDGVWHDATMTGLVGSGWIQFNQSDDRGYRVVQGFSGTPLWDEQLQSVAGMVTVADVLGVRAAFAIPATTLRVAVPEIGTARENPFPGLLPYTESMRSEFLARDGEADTIARELREQRSLTILGPSGSGKSSLALAGVVPRMRAVGYDVVVARAGDGPGVLRAGSAGRDGGRLLVVVDQLEEVCLLPPQERDAFALVLSELGEGSETRILATLRPDFLGLVQSDRTLRSLVTTESVYPLSPLDQSGLQDVVERVGAPGEPPEYESGLVDRIVADASTSAAPMPLLSHALASLWRGVPGRLTHHAYREAGGVQGALDHALDRWLDTVPPGIDLGVRLPTLFTALVRHDAETGSWTRGSARLAELDEVTRDLARGLTSAGMLVASYGPGSESGSGDDVRVELVHDSLLKLWGRLSTFIRDNEAFLVWHERLRLDANRWLDQGRRGELLPTAAELQVAERWKAASPDRIAPELSEYIAAGRARQMRRRRIRRLVLIVGACVLVVVLSAVAAIGIARGRAADEQRFADSRILAEQARELASQDVSVGILAAVAAWDTAPTEEARDELLAQQLTYRGFDRLLPPGLGGQQEVAFSADGDTVVTVSRWGRVTIYSQALSGPVQSEHVTELSLIRFVDISRDGTRVVAFDELGHGYWFPVQPDGKGYGEVRDLQDATDIVPGFTPQIALESIDPVGGVGFSADAETVVGWVGGADFVSWDLRTGKAIDHVHVPDGADRTLGVAPDGDPVITKLNGTDRDGSEIFDVFRVDLATGAITKIASSGEGWALLSGDGTSLVRCQYGAMSVSLDRFRVADGTRTGHVIVEEDSTTPSCLLSAVDFEGRLVTKQTSIDDVGSDGRAVVDLDREVVVARDRVPGTSSPTNLKGLLVGNNGRYFDVADLPFPGSSLGYFEVPARDDVAHEFIDHVLLDGGRTMLTLKDDGRSVDTFDFSWSDDGVAIIDEPRKYLLEQRSEDAPGHVLAEAEVQTTDWTWRASDGIRLSPDGTTIAVRDGLNTVVLLDDALRRVRTITAAEPAVSEQIADRSPTRDLNGQAGLTESIADADGFAYFFDATGDVVTVSDDLVQLWNSGDGTEAGRYDTGSLFPDAEDRAFPGISPTAVAGQVAVTMPGKPGTHVVNLLEGRVVDVLPTRSDIASVQFSPDGDHMVLHDAGGSIEIVDASTMDRLIGPLRTDGERDISDSGEVGNGGHLARFLPGGRLLVATHDALVTYDLEVPDPTVGDRIKIPDDGSGAITDVSDDGRSVIYTPQYQAAAVIHLDSDTWRSELCSVIGHRVLDGGELSHLIDGEGPLDICGGKVTP